MTGLKPRSTDERGLPKPDAYGNYWLDERDHLFGPAVMPSKWMENGEVCYRGGWLALVGPGEGFIYDGRQLKRFDSPQLALEAITDALARIALKKQEVKRGKY